MPKVVLRASKVVFYLTSQDLISSDLTSSDLTCRHAFCAAP
jgi:hypothetical protein